MVGIMCEPVIFDLLKKIVEGNNSSVEITGLRITEDKMSVRARWMKTNLSLGKFIENVSSIGPWVYDEYWELRNSNEEGGCFEVRFKFAEPYLLTLLTEKE